MAYDFVVVGAGMFGAAFARMATDRGRKVLVVERKNNLGGACHSSKVGEVHVHRYGPHIFHTDNRGIWSWIQRFGEFRPFTLRSKARHQDRIYSLPFNLATFNQLWGVTTPEEARRRLDKERLPIPEPRNLEEWALSRLGLEIYEKLVYGYTKKQWGREPRHLPPLILKRLPIRLTYDDNYFDDAYQGMPVEGYAALFERMLDGIEVRLGCDYLTERAALDRMGKVVYSGRADELHGFRYGSLAFRSLRFETRAVEGDYQGVGLVYHTDADVPFTRTVEHQHLGFVRVDHGPVSWEYPFECGPSDDAFYPVNDGENDARAQKYLAEPTNTVIGGRQGTYKYLDMHQVIAQARKLCDELT
jgi:UDP-galactopyranose mutase